VADNDIFQVPASEQAEGAPIEEDASADPSSDLSATLEPVEDTLFGGDALEAPFAQQPADPSPAPVSAPAAYMPLFVAPQPVTFKPVVEDDDDEEEPLQVRGSRDSFAALQQSVLSCALRRPAKFDGCPPQSWFFGDRIIGS